MKRKKDVSASDSARSIRPALTIEARENQMVGLAVDLAEKQLLEGTASSQVITHYLKLGSPTARLERQILEKKRDLMVAQTEALQSAKRIEELYEKAMDAMKMYRGSDDDKED